MCPQRARALHFAAQGPFRQLIFSRGGGGGSGTGDGGDGGRSGGGAVGKYLPTNLYLRSLPIPDPPHTPATTNLLAHFYLRLIPSLLKALWRSSEGCD